MTKLLAFVVVLALVSPLVFAEDPLCCSTTSYSDVWTYCNSAAGLWNMNSCLTCASYQCIDWTVGSTMNQAREKSFKQRTGVDVYFGVGSYGNDQTRAGLCYRVTVTGVQTDLIVQVVNQGGDVPDGNFDLQMGDGGFGIYNACVSDGTSVPQFDGSASQWGNQYGGWYNRNDCYNLPSYPHCNTSHSDNLQNLCTWSFDQGLRNGNPTITKMCNVRCPDELVKATGLQRSDQPSGYTCTSGIASGGQLTRMMDCAKPSYGWSGNVKGPTVSGYEIVVPCRRDGYTRINQL